MNLKYFLFLLIFVLGSFLRFYNLGWDKEYSFHPDEVNLSNSVSQIRFFEQMNPNFFQYNNFTIYLYKVTGYFLLIITKNTDWIVNIAKITLIGRFYSALFSSITIILIFYLTKIITKSMNVALLASLFTALTVSLIQSAHFAVTDSILTFILIMIAIINYKSNNNYNYTNFFLVSVFIGISLSIKSTAIYFCIIPVTDLIIELFRFKNIKKFINFLIILITTSTLFFFLLSPYSFLKWDNFKAGMILEKEIISGTKKVSWNYQFLHTLPYLYQIKNLFWQMGPLLPLTSIFGFIYLVIKQLREINLKIVSLLSWSLSYFLSVGSFHVKFIRYFIPLLPFFCIFSAWLLIEIYQSRRLFGRTIILVVILTTFLYNFAFFAIYKKEQTRILASSWIYNNIPPKSNILTEDEVLPLNYKNSSGGFYNLLPTLPSFETDNLNKLDIYTNRLAEADYFILPNRRTYGTLTKLSREYPLTSNFYNNLVNGNLGFKKIKEFYSYPSIFGLNINDDTAEETFQVFDHPKIIIYKNISKKSFQDIKAILVYNIELN